MRKSAWILVLFFWAIIAPAAHADTVEDASFTCDTTCVSVPTDPPVTFPSPNIPINFFNQSFNIILNSLDHSSDTYTWGVGLNNSNWFFEINDLTNGQCDYGPSFSYGGSGAPYGGGGVYFNCPTTAPEPSSVSLLLLSLLAAFVLRKFLRPQTI